MKWPTLFSGKRKENISKHLLLKYFTSMLGKNFEDYTYSDKHQRIPYRKGQCAGYLGPCCLHMPQTISEYGPFENTEQIKIRQ